MVSCTNLRVSTTASAQNYPHYVNQNYQCDQNLPPSLQHMDGRGVTYWGGEPYCNSNSNNNNSGATYTISAGNSQTITFTNTIPRCYTGQGACLVFFKATGPSNASIIVKTYTNRNQYPNQTPGPFIVLGNGGWQCIDLAFSGLYHDAERNTFTFENTGSQSVIISNFQIMRIYAMGAIGCDDQSLCNGTGDCGQSGTSTDNYGDYYGRLDYPCNLNVSTISGNWGNCGGRSFTFYQNSEFYGMNGIMAPQDCLKWNYDFGPYSQYNYVGPEVCLFNVNGVALTQPNETGSLELYVNGVYATTFYISNYWNNYPGNQLSWNVFSPSYNLVDCAGYIDNGYNEILLKNTSTTGASIYLTDSGGVNIYRTYKTGSVCTIPPPYVSTNATADVAVTASQDYTRGTSPAISWVCADDYGAYYCYITEVIVDGASHSPYDYGSANAGSIAFNNIQSDHSVVVHSAPYYYPVTFNQYAHNDNFGDMLVNSWTEYHVAWEERDGPVYSHGSDLHGGGGVDYYVDSAIDDPWGYGTDYFNYAMAHNWGGGSESYYYGIPLNVYTYVWGNTVDIWYNWQGWYGMNGKPSNTLNTDKSTQPTVPTYPANFTPPASTPYIYNSAANTYTIVT